MIPIAGTTKIKELTAANALNLQKHGHGRYPKDWTTHQKSGNFHAALRALKVSFARDPSTLVEK